MIILNNRIVVLLALASLVLLCACSGIRYQGAKASGSGDTENAAVAANADAQGMLTDKRLQLLNEKAQIRELFIDGEIDESTFNLLQQDVDRDFRETDYTTNYSKRETEGVRGYYNSSGKTRTVNSSLRIRSDGNVSRNDGAAGSSVAIEHDHGRYYTFTGSIDVSQLPTAFKGFPVMRYVMTKKEFLGIPKGAIVLIAKEDDGRSTKYHTSWNRTYSRFLKRVPYAECGHMFSAMVRGVDYWLPND